MWFSKKPNADTASQVTTKATAKPTTKVRGDAAEAIALAHLQAAGLRLLQRNFKTPGRGGGEIDLVMSAPDGTLVFIEVRQRASATHGGAGASIGTLKQRRIVFAARHYLMRYKTLPPCRFDVLLIEGALVGPEAPKIQWLRGAFDAS